MTTDTALVQIDPTGDPRVLALASEVQELIAHAATLVVASEDDQKLATEDMVIIQGLSKAFEDKRKEYVAPLNGYVKAINEAFKEFTAPLDAAGQLIRGKLLAYQAEQVRIRQEQEAINRLRMEAAQREMELKGELTESVGLVEVAPPPPAHIRTAVGMAGIVRTWQFEVVDFALLPDMYKLPDLPKIRKMVQAGGTIPGIRAWQEEQLRVTGVR